MIAEVTEPGDADLDDPPDILDIPATEELQDLSQAVSDGRDGERPEKASGM